MSLTSNSLTNRSLTGMSLTGRIGAIFVVTALVRLAFYYLTGFTADDAFITFRYADNIASGLGFVYNAGQPVQGTTTPLFTYLMSLLRLIGLPPVTAALFLSSIASGATAVVIYKFALSLRFTRWAILPVVFYMLWPRSLPAETSGMETALFTLFVTAAFYCRHRGLDIYAVGMATLASVTRPEGLIVLVLVVAANIYHNRRKWLAYVVIPLMILGPWLVFAQLYFGSILPNSVPAKLALYSRWGTMSIWDTFVYLMAWHNTVGMVTTLAVIIGVWWLHKKQNFGYLELFWMVTMIVFYTFNSSHIFFWYIASIYPIYLLFAAAAVVFAAERFAASAERDKLWRMIVIPLAVIALLFGCWKPVNYYKDWQRAQEATHRTIGVFLSAAAMPGDMVAAEDIGYMGYYSRLRVLDRDGLVSPETIPYNSSGDYYGLIRDFRPDWVVASTDSPISAFVADSAFIADYRTRISCTYKDSEYRLYQRRDYKATHGLSDEIPDEMPDESQSAPALN